MRNEFLCELKQLDEAEGTFAGCLSVYGVKDSHNDIVVAGAFTESLAANGGRVPLLWQHAEPVGSLELTDSPAALIAKGELDLDVEVGRRAHSAIKKGYVKGLSIG